MTLVRSLPLFLLLAACGKDEIPAPTTPNAGTGGTSVTRTEGNCSNGTDDDGDGLLDCEDEDCIGAAACKEDDCTNGEDDDGDGFYDCHDADCWGNGCAVARTKLTAAGRVSWREGDLNFTTTAPSCSNYALDSAMIEVQSPVGFVQYLSPQGATFECDWSADRSWVLDVNPQTDHFANPRLLLREGFTVDAGCPLQDPTFAPHVVTLDTGTGMWAMRTGASGSGVPWFGWQGAQTPYDSTAVNQSNVGSCNYRVQGQRNTVTWSQADVGFDYFAIAARTFQIPDTSTQTP